MAKCKDTHPIETAEPIGELMLRLSKFKERHEEHLSAGRIPGL